MLQEINNFIQHLNQRDEIEAILLYGSAAMGNLDDISDIDLIICCNSKDFHTPISVYEAASKNIENKIKPTIKSLAEFDPNNYVTMTRRYLQHLHNVGQVLYEKPDTNLKNRIEHMWSNLKNDTKIDIAYKVAPSLMIRHRVFELYKGTFTKVLNDKGNRIERPSKHFWQEAVSVLKSDISREDESKIVEKFYEIIPSGSVDEIYNIRKAIGEINKRILSEGLSQSIKKEIKDIYSKFKDIVERDMWAFNKYLMDI